MQNPFFSIIVPNYNNEQYLAQALQSIKNQTFNNYELILIDDGSKGTDGYPNSQTIFNSVFGTNSNHIFIKSVNNGVSSARNKGLDSAKGTIILFLDADDYYLPDYLTELHTELTQYEDQLNCTMFIANDGIMFRTENDVDTPFNKPMIEQRAKHNSILKELVFFSAPAPLLIIPRVLIDNTRFNLGLFIGEEPQLMLDIYFNFKHKYNTKINVKPLFSKGLMYRKHANSITTIDDGSNIRERTNYKVIYKNVISNPYSTIIEKIVAKIGFYRYSIDPMDGPWHKYSRKALTLIAKVITGWYL